MNLFKYENAKTCDLVIQILKCSFFKGRRADGGVLPVDGGARGRAAAARGARRRRAAAHPRGRGSPRLGGAVPSRAGVPSCAVTTSSVEGVFDSLPHRGGEGPSTATKTPPPARGWAAGTSCTFLYGILYGIYAASQNSPQM